jgi:tetratricopeptide (TPR) repeat protein
MNTNPEDRLDPAEVLNGAQGALRAGRLDHASEIAEAGVAQGMDHPLLLNLAAYRLEMGGRYSAAIELLHRALDRSPGDASVLNSIGVCYSKSAMPEAALEAFDAAIANQPAYAVPHNGRGLALAALGDRSGAEAAMRRAAELDPKFPDPLSGLATIAVDERRFDDARDFAARALALDPNQPPALLALAAVEARDGQAASALTRIEALLAAGGLAPLHEAAALRRKADVLDALGRYDEAFDAYRAGNAVTRRLFWPAYDAAQVEFGVEYCTRLLNYFEAADPGKWRGKVTASPAARHVFLVGFPRSGTTLLEQILASHPDVVALEERPTLEPLTLDYFADNAGLDRLASLPTAELDKLRAGYWARVKGFGAEVEGKVFVDKGPLNTIYLPLIAKLFPDAKIIVAIRDPRDVVLSCYRRPFRASPIVFEFSDLIRTAHLYDRVMRLGVAYEPLTGLATHLHRHERMIEAFDEEIELLCGFLGLSFEPEAMRDFAETAQRRDVRTPSADQVRRPLNAEGVGQWRRYREGMAPVLPLLAPWVEAFGYPPDDADVP